MNKFNLKVGQILYIDLDYNRGKVEEYEILKIGRKWAELKWPGSRFPGVRGRVDIETLAYDGRYATVWLSLEDRAKAKELRATWEAFRRAVYEARGRPELATLEAMAEARRLLGL